MVLYTLPEPQKHQIGIGLPAHLSSALDHTLGDDSRDRQAVLIAPSLPRGGVPGRKNLG
jgi:hypothetical protein